MLAEKVGGIEDFITQAAQQAKRASVAAGGGGQ